MTEIPAPATGLALSRPAREWAERIRQVHVPDAEDPPPTITDGERVIRLDHPDCCRQCSGIGFRPEHGLIAWPCDAWLLATALLEGGSPAASQPGRAPGPQQR